MRPVHWSKRNPFIELFPYDEVQSGYFFGREADTRNIVERIYRSSVVVLYGESGVGKTSIINAGIIPLLQREGTIVLRMAANHRFSTEELIDRLRQIASELLDTRTDAHSSIESLFYSLGRAFRQYERRLVIVLDQFEALFPSSDNNLSRLGHDIAKLVPVAKQFDSVAVVISLRSDCLDDLGIWATECQIPELLADAYPLRRFSVAQAKEILTEVPAIVNAEFSAGVTEAIVRDLQELGEGEIYPPNLQIVAKKVFDEARMHGDPSIHKLTVGQKDYEAAGSAKSVLEAFLDDKLSNLGDNQNVAREVLLALVSTTGRRLSLSAVAISEKVSLDSEKLRPVVESLTQARLIRSTDQPNVYELVHDVLATRILEATDDEQRKAKGAREAFELALSAWQSEGVLESGRRLDWYYRHRQWLDLVLWHTFVAW